MCAVARGGGVVDIARTSSLPSYPHVYFLPVNNAK